MNTYVPGYYKKFKCIADKCKHSCCIGWEIDIDSQTMDYYNSLKGDMAHLLKENISLSNEPHFILKEGDRCPFLKDDGLCKLICELGEDSLCNICSDHPRFRNFYSGGVEMGLGLCCEEAARIILNSTEPFSMEGNGDIYTEDEEKVLINKRNMFISVMENSTISISQRFTELMKKTDTSLPEMSPGEWNEFFLSLERLDPKWTNTLERFGCIAPDEFANPDQYALPLEKLTVYFLYRHMPSALYDLDESSKVTFAVLGTLFVHTLALSFENEYKTYMDALCDFARMFSAEIEYSDENLDVIIEKLLI